MGLKAFHLFFIGVCSVFCGWLAWFFQGIGEESGGGYLAAAGVAAACALALVGYGVAFARKMRRLHIQ
jgi:hypothetical protein